METEIKPMVNQIKFHPGKMQKEVVDYSKAAGIQVEAWSPLGQGSILQNEMITSIADEKGKTPAQICLRWCIQNDIIPLPRSQSAVRIAENLDVFDFSLTEDEMSSINDLDDGQILDSDQVNL